MLDFSNDIAILLGFLGFIALGYLFTGLMLNLSDYMVARYHRSHSKTDSF